MFHKKAAAIRPQKITLAEWLSDIEPRFVCQACGIRAARMRGRCPSD
jgi:Rubredoxin metal binding domain